MANAYASVLEHRTTPRKDGSGRMEAIRGSELPFFPHPGHPIPQGSQRHLWRAVHSEEKEAILGGGHC